MPKTIFFISWLLLCPWLLGQSLQEQLKAQYEIVRTASDSNGIQVIKPGTVLTIQKGGILGVPRDSAFLCGSKFQNGELEPPGRFCTSMLHNERFLAAGEKVYPLRIDINLKKDSISFHVMECDACNQVEQESSYHGVVIFQFPKGTLATTSIPQIEDTISQVLAMEAEQ